MRWRNHRVKKESYNSGSLQSTTYYVRDIAGQVLAIYSNTTLVEQPIYGSGRIGLYRKADNSTTYQLTDHLGNVRATFQKSGSTTTNEDYNDYYPGGMMMPGRNSVNANTDNKSNIEKRTTGTTTVGGMAMNYTNDAFPKTNVSEVLSVNYYDDYSFTDSDKPTTPTTVQGQTVTTRTQGLQTANFSKTIGHTTWTKLYTYYDEKGREIKIHNKNHLGGYTTMESKLDFREKTDLAVTKHKRVTSDTELVINDRFTYDYAERSLGHFQKINAQAEERIAENEYDELGILIKKKVGGLSSSSTPLQELAYQYNIRGQFKALNDVNALGNTLFAFKINYNKAAEGASTAPAQYNGNITQTIWRSAYDNTKRGYAYLYDKLNRISQSKYQFNDNLNGNTAAQFNTQLSYDEQGNIKTLSRNGSSSSAIDQLTYNYGTVNGNQLLSVSDTASSSQGFVDGNTSGNDYDYDDNGNMTKNLNKGITKISYNHLDLIKQISLPNSKTLAFTYDAAGAKLQKRYISNLTSDKVTDYLGGFQYNDGYLRFFPTPEGYVYKSGSTYKYMYIYADHLGNNRVSYTDVNGNGSIETSELASNHNYYPFGGIHSGAYTDGLAAVYKYTFQGKEFQDEDGLDWHDFGSRMYDPALGRWMATDPQNQFGSPYLALGNNPIRFIDPDGELIIESIVLGAFLNVATQDMAGNISNFGEFAKSAIIGAAAGAAGQIVPVGGATSGLINGFSGGFTSGFLGTIVNGGTFNDAFNAGINSGLFAGLINGGLSGLNAVAEGRDFFSGKEWIKAGISSNTMSAGESIEDIAARWDVVAPERPLRLGSLNQDGHEFGCTVFCKKTVDKFFGVTGQETINDALLEMADANSGLTPNLYLGKKGVYATSGYTVDSYKTGFLVGRGGTYSPQNALPWIGQKLESGSLVKTFFNIPQGQHAGLIKQIKYLKDFSDFRIHLYDPSTGSRTLRSLKEVFSLFAISK
ncbi:RHS repeat-associated core domain-containing protein [Muricauda sp. SCSIO 64092]|uniref:RHS repeat domain-containing protein n=1 Tax=Allomuricauda sp. SCSIO 64092 TaxID=2908842 RepID=UPI001FF4F4B6|nr:RHS repeat-associated core domain-containing protein [Muricauda sp. SCSIO 64092]UOY08645.1 RHS repeat-associated core domain-containing protein [Muricauda sp. SCSIO 64092]